MMCVLLLSEAAAHVLKPEGSTEEAGVPSPPTVDPEVQGNIDEMQDLGQPPTELVGDMGPPQGFAAPAVPDAAQCSIM
ncbi:hypothetical protein HF086_014617 [Spodoptera exigua]|uniref:Uncharacterized protein n=1 Tax=Spodoptera exigua TaxID=7107 RepID=A0A922M6T3_SPOEX|nr:hypothetical protein HF086_014617 [Spodoptera exigua]